MDIILAHKQPDFDALASMVAAQKLYPGSVLVMDGKANPYVQDFLAVSKDRLPLRKQQDIDLTTISRVILVDTHELRRTGNLGEKLAQVPNLTIEIYDHHPYTGSLTPNMCIELVGACTTLLVERLAGQGLPLSSFEATLLTLGIYEDTGSLLFENTTVRDVRAVAYLLEQGAHLGVVAEYLRKPLTDEQKVLLQEILDNGQTEIIEGGVPVYLSYAETREYIGGLALLAHRVGELEGAETWFLLVKMENRVYIVGRSRGKGLPVNQIVQAFGGSGHAKAASATIKTTDGPAILEKLRQKIRERVQHPYLARDVMSFPVKTVTPDTLLSDVQQMLLRYGHTGVPVTDGKRLVGIISRRDVEKSIKHGLEHAPVKGFMTTNVITVQSSAGWDEVQRLMVQYDIGRLPVVEDGKVVGIISRSDVLRLVHGSAVPIEGALVRERSQAMLQDIMELIQRLPDHVRNLLETVRDVAYKEKCSVFLVGGFVRDLLLLVPTQDLDFVVEGSGLQFATALIRQFPEGELTLHSKFGTARITFPDGTHLDVASTRWEYYAYPGALPQVEESCLKDDLFRRDFTMNAMAICLTAGRYGELVDYYGGIRDLQQGEIRLLHNLSFIDDPTRIMRAIRFAKRYRFQLAKETTEALNTALKAGVLRKLSIERFTEELMLIFQEKNYLSMGRSLVELGVFSAWFEGDFAWNFAETEEKDHDAWPLVMRWLAALSQIAATQVEEILARLRLTRYLREATLDYIRLRTMLKSTSFTLAQVDNLLARFPVWMVKLLGREAEVRDLLLTYQVALANLNKMSMDGLGLQALGVRRGPQIGEILGRIRQAWLAGQLHSVAEEEELVRKILRTQS